MGSNVCVRQTQSIDGPISSVLIASGNCQIRQRTAVLQARSTYITCTQPPSHIATDIYCCRDSFELRQCLRICVDCCKANPFNACLYHPHHCIATRSADTDNLYYAR
jgi:hypothetical protein